MKEAWIHMMQKMASDQNKVFIKEFIVLALPVAVQRLIFQVLQLTDNLMVGSLGEDCISAVAICNTFLWLSITFLEGTSEGATIICSQAYGKRDIKKIKDTFSFIMAINVGLAIVFYFLSASFSKEILSLYSNVPEIVEVGVEYLSVIKYGFIFNAISISMVHILHSVKNVKIGFYSTGISCLVNIFLNWVFIYGNLGMPALGIRGAALGTLISRILEAAFVAVYFLCFEKTVHFTLRDFQPKPEVKELHFLMKVTLPIMIMDVLNNFVSTAQTMITGHISKYYVSANSIVHATWTLPSVFSIGLGIAAGIMIGNQIGEGKWKEAEEYAHKFIITSLVFGLINSGILLLLLPIISGFYNVSAETLLLTGKMGRVAAITVIFVSMSFVLCNGVIKAKGNTGILLGVDIVANWVIAVPLGYIAAFHLNCPPEYLYLILRSGNIVRTLWGAYRIKTGKWLLA